MGGKGKGRDKGKGRGAPGNGNGSTPGRGGPADRERKWFDKLSQDDTTNIRTQNRTFAKLLIFRGELKSLCLGSCPSFW